MRLLKKMHKKESGQAFIFVLIFLLLGGLIITPLLAFMGSGLTASKAYHLTMAGVYAADAGIEDAIWHIQTRSDNVPTDEATPTTTTLTDELNNKTVEYIMEYIDDNTYKVTSTATEAGSSVTVVSYVAVEEYDFLLNSAITSNTNVEIGPNSTVSGNITCPDGELDWGNNTTWDSPPSEQFDPMSREAWPLAEQLIWFYMQDVEGLASPYDDYPDDQIDVDDNSVDDNSTIEALLRDGDLAILSSQNDIVATLLGTVYVTGDLNIGSTNKDFTIDLNGQTIFVESDSDVAIDIGGKCTFTGSGCIVAIGGIKAYPHVASAPDEFILIMSLEGTVDLQPIGNYYGAVVGDSTVNMQPNNYLEWVDPLSVEGGLNFPWEGYQGDKVLTKMRTWEINPPD